MRLAIQALSQARMGTALKIRMESGDLTAEDVSDLQEDMDEFLRDHPTHSTDR